MRYATKQRKKLFDVLESHFDETLSIERIVLLIGDGSVSRSAIYRNLAELETDGYVKRLPLPPPQKTGYRFVGSDDCKRHLHLTCSICGRTYHLPLPTSNALIENVMRDSGFKVDASNTVLAGICGNCIKN